MPPHSLRIADGLNRAAADQAGALVRSGKENLVARTGVGLAL